MSPLNSNRRSQKRQASLDQTLQEAVTELDLNERFIKVNQWVEAQQKDMDLASDLLDNLESLKSSLSELEPLLRFGPGPEQNLRYGEALASYKQFDAYYAQFKRDVVNNIIPLLDEIVDGMAEDLYEFGTFGSPDFDDYNEQSRHLKEVFGPDGDIHLKRFHELKLGRKSPGNHPSLSSKKRPDKDRSLTHLKNVLFLSSIREIDGVRTTQEEISKLTDYGQSKISLDLFMAKQVLLESWLEERLRALPNVVISVGATGVSSYNGNNSDIDDTYDRWPRDGFGYLVLENTLTRQPAIIMLHIFENSFGPQDRSANSGVQLEEARPTLSKTQRNPRQSIGSRKWVIQNYMSQLRNSSSSELAKRYPDQFRMLPIGHFISTGRHYETAFVLDANLPKYFQTPDIGGYKKEDSIADFFA